MFLSDDIGSMSPKMECISPSYLGSKDIYRRDKWFHTEAHMNIFVNIAVVVNIPGNVFQCLYCLETHSFGCFWLFSETNVNFWWSKSLIKRPTFLKTHTHFLSQKNNYFKKEFPPNTCSFMIKPKRRKNYFGIFLAFFFMLDGFWADFRHWSEQQKPLKLHLVFKYIFSNWSIFRS